MFVKDPRALEGFRVLGELIARWWKSLWRAEPMDYLMDPNKPDWDLPPRSRQEIEDDLLLDALGVVVHGRPISADLESLFSIGGLPVVSIMRSEEGIIEACLEGGVTVIWVASTGHVDV